jgi:hypothetical protein
MKKIILVLAALFCVATVSAKDGKFVSGVKDFGNAVAEQTWTAGLRIGSGLQATAEWMYSDAAYVEGRFGMSWCNAGAVVMADFTALHNWNVCTMDWTPSAGEWFFDAGCGVGVGGREHYCYVGAAGCAKLGIKLNSVPLRIAVDWTPVIGPEIAYGGGQSAAAFNKYGLANFGVSCAYCF